MNYDYKTFLLKIILIMLASAPLSYADSGDIYQFDEPKQAVAFQELLRELRCLVCQNQDLSDSNATFAKDMRTEIYVMLRQGSSKTDVIDYLTKRYGDFILFAPPLQANTYLLWIGPFVLLAGGLLILFLFLWRRNRVQVTS